ncbi:MAG: DUF6807 family protein [Thermoguttaceae bacterium]
MNRIIFVTTFLLSVTTLFAAENTTRNMASGSFGVAWIDDTQTVRVFDGATVSEVASGTKVGQLVAADLLETGDDQLAFLDTSVKGLHLYDFKEKKHLGPFGNNVCTVTTGYCTSDEKYPSVVASTFSGASFRWTRDVMEKGWIPIAGQFSAVAAGRFRRNSTTDDFAVIDAGNVYIYSPKWDTYSKVAEGKEAVAIIAGDVTPSAGDEIVLIDKTGNLWIVQNKTVENMQQKAVCLTLGANGEQNPATLYAVNAEGHIVRYVYDKKTWQNVNAERTWNGVVTRTNPDGKGHTLYAVSGGVLFRIVDGGAKSEQLFVPTPVRAPLQGKNGKILATYRFESVPKKPYVEELRTPSGKNILRDSPADHVHHHALMFAIFADGCDFWIETTPDCGQQVTRKLDADASKVVSQIDWCLADSKPVLHETRTVHVTDGDGVTILDWETTLTPVADTITLGGGGGHYFGLGMRFVESMDRDGRFFHDGEKPKSEVVRGDEQLTPCSWMAYTAKCDGEPVTVAVFDSAKNLRPMLAFTMGQDGKSFAYISATLDLHREPLVIKKSKPLTLRYRVAVWDGEVSPETVAKVAP